MFTHCTGTAQCLHPVPVLLNVYTLYRYRSMITTCTGTVQCLHPVPVPCLYLYFILIIKCRYHETLLFSLPVPFNIHVQLPKPINISDLLTAPLNLYNPTLIPINTKFSGTGTGVCFAIPVPDLSFKAQVPYFSRYRTGTRILLRSDTGTGDILFRYRYRTSHQLLQYRRQYYAPRVPIYPPYRTGTWIFLVVSKISITKFPIPE